MRAFGVIKRLVRYKRFKTIKHINTAKKVAKPIALMGAGGGLAGYLSSMPGHRNDGMKEGIAIGAGGGALAGAASLVGKIIFRRFRGRIIPIRVKK